VAHRLVDADARGERHALLDLLALEHLVALHLDDRVAERADLHDRLAHDALLDDALQRLATHAPPHTTTTSNATSERCSGMHGIDSPTPRVARQRTRMTHELANGSEALQNPATAARGKKTRCSHHTAATRS
jgi:hypothetical protein